MFVVAIFTEESVAFFDWIKILSLLTPQSLLFDNAGFFFIPLTSRLINDGSANCRQLTALAVKTLLGKVSTVQCPLSNAQIRRGCFTSARRGEFYFRVVKKIQEKITIISSSCRVVPLLLLLLLLLLSYRQQWLAAFKSRKVRHIYGTNFTHGIFGRKTLVYISNENSYNLLGILGCRIAGPLSYSVFATP